MTSRKKTTEETTQPISKKDFINSVIKKRQKNKFLTQNQEEYYNTLKENQITICSGPAGTGKSHVSLKSAIDLLLDYNNTYEKLIIVRPAVESSDSKLGSLPGDVREKMDPYIYASYYLLQKIIGKDATLKLEESGIIEIMSLSFIRGISIDNAILVFEESQNATPNEMKTVLTRIGFNSKFFISGDIEQSDKFKQKEKSGLYDALTRLQDMKDVGIFKFKPEDIVRNPIITEIIKRYDTEY
jgi:phosphate starvation-inducible protein PhoH and related proteins